MGGLIIARLLSAMKALSFVLFCLVFSGATAQEPPSIGADSLPSADEPTLISADEVIYDKKLDMVIASGNVEVSQDDRVVVADKITYNIGTGTVAASGNVTIVEPSGNVVFADYIELSADLRDAFIRDIRILLNDNSRLAGASAERSEGRYMVLQKGVFSPCELCRKDPESRAHLADQGLPGHPRSGRQDHPVLRRLDGDLRRADPLHALLRTPRPDGKAQERLSWRPASASPIP